LYFSLRDAVECSSRGGRGIVLQGIQRQVRGHHQGSWSHPSGNCKSVDRSAGVRRGPVQPGTVRGD